MTLSLGDAEYGFVDPESNHRPNEVEILLEALFVDSDPFGLQVLAEVGQHGVVDDEIRLHDLTAGRRLRDACIALGVELLRVAGKRLPTIQKPSHSTRIESLDGTDNPLVGLDAAATIDGTSGIGAFEIARVVRPVDLLILQLVAQILVERRVP